MSTEEFPADAPSAAAGAGGAFGWTAKTPEFIDNRDGNTLAVALSAILGGAGGGLAEPAVARPTEIAVAAAFFSPAGLACLAPHLDGLQKIRLLFGVEAPREAEVERPRVGESRERFEARLMREGLREAEEAARAARDRFPFTREGVEALRRLVARLRGQNVAVRRYERSFLHAKAYLFWPADGAVGGLAGVIAGSSNLTGGGLQRNLELNLGRYDGPIIREARRWFESLWEEAVPVDIAALYEEIFAPYSPWVIFLRILYQLYGEEVAALEKEDKGLPLTSFQAHGLARALRLLSDCGGAIVADEVGLGKTFIAGEAIRLYHGRRQRALLICPAQLRDTTWKKFLARFQFDLAVDCVSYEQLANDRQLADLEHAGAARETLPRKIDEYQLVVVDEAHNYRNPDAPTRAAVLRRLLFGQKRDLLLLTATPVNNSLWDLFHLIRFFARQDAFLADRGVLSIYERFRQAMREDPSNLSPDLLYPIIDATCVKRTRQFVKKYYGGDTIIGPDGQTQPIAFPQPVARTVRYALDPPLPALFDEIEKALDPQGGEGAITFARYGVDLYRRERDATDDEAESRAAATVGLIRSALLKRFESSAFAFRRTLVKLIRGHEIFREALRKGFVVTTRFLEEIGEDDAVLEETLAGSTYAMPADLFDSEALDAAVRADLAVLKQLRDAAGKIEPERDPKLRTLVAELGRIAAEARAEAVSASDEAQKRKVLVYSFFADTVEYLRDYLRPAAGCDPGLAAYRGRLVAVTGGDDLGEGSREAALAGFAPVSTGVMDSEDLYDLMITTDVLAEGVNLQQCRHIINFDVPWNPMRLVQRHGRIDRIGSPHARVYLRTIFPAERLDQLLNLEQRILAKIAMAAASIGVASPVQGAAHGEQVFTETREEIERLLREDNALYERGGTVSAAQSGEEYRQTLRQALAGDRERIVNLPWKAGSGMAKGRDRGVLFCATVGGRTYLRFVRADAAWKPGPGDAPIAHEIGACLRLAECEPETPRVMPEGLEEEAIFGLWHTAQNDIWHAWMVETDPANLQPKLRPLNRQVAEFIRANPPPDAGSERIRRALDVLESPWPRREEVMLRDWFGDASRGGGAKSAWLVERILGTGLEPFREPPTLPPIRREEIELICWLAIVPAEAGAGACLAG